MANRRDFLKGMGGILAATIAAPQVRAQSRRNPVVQRYPYVQNLRNDGVTISWTTTEDGAADLLYTDGRTPNIVRAASRIFTPSATRLGFPYYEHRVHLTGLKPGTEYGYRVTLEGSDLTPDDVLQFKTASPGSFRFVAFGDCGQGTREQARVADWVLRAQPALALILGDLVYPGGTFEYYQAHYFDYYAALMKRVPFYPCPGNHDYLSDAGKAYLAVHSVPTGDVPQEDSGRYYSFDWGNVHFVSLDSDVALRSVLFGEGRMLEWLEADLQKTRQFWRVVYFHHPPYASGPNVGDPLSAFSREKLVPILERHNVQMVFSGHEHSYQRSEPIRDGGVVEPNEGTVYMTSGGGGAFLYPVYASPLIAKSASVHHFVMADVLGFQIKLRTVRLDGVEIDAATLAPPPKALQAVRGDLADDPENAPGGIVTIRGRYLAADARSASARPLPREINGTSVTLGGERIPLYAVAQDEIVAALPFAVEGEPTLRVLTPNGSDVALARPLVDERPDRGSGRGNRLPYSEPGE